VATDKIDWNAMDWEDIKKDGSGHYRLGETQPIDLYKTMAPDAFRHWIMLEIVQHILRNITVPGNNYFNDLSKIRHYVEMLMVLWKEKEENVTNCR